VYEKTDEQTVSLFFPKQTTLAARLHLDAAAATLSQDEEQFIDFVRLLLCLDPTRRVTAAEALEHRWLEDADRLKIPAPNLVASK
jgi:serine/threonine protein kinase